MGMLIDGKWDPDAKGTTASDGSFVRAVSPYRNFITSPQIGDYPAEKNRYNLIVSFACPWAHRTLLYRSILNLEDYIGVSVVHPISYPNGWTFERFKDVENNSHMYFVHSYEFIPNDKNVISATIDYSTNIVCSAEKENLFGTQFHPEKSDKIGLKIIDNFINL